IQVCVAATSAAALPAPLRAVFHEELDQLRIQVELMGVRVDQNLERMRQVLDHGEEGGTFAAAVVADDEIDAMHVSLMERCYDLLNREAPMAGRPPRPLSGARVSTAD